MKTLFHQHSQGYSWSNNHEYILCTQEEYDELVKRYEGHPNEICHEDQFGKRCYPNSKQVYTGKITANPTTLVMDGFCSRGGRKFEAEGLTVRTNVSPFYDRNDNSDYKHYIKPGTIIVDEETPTEEWWAS